MGAEDAFSSNAASYTQRQVTQEQLRATQEELSTKIRELQIYESNYIQLKKELSRWKKKFEYIFRENELLSLETAKLDASHKQIAFLQQEIKFKEEESNALRGLVSALEASNKKARVSRLDTAARLADKKDLPAAAVAGAALLESDTAAANSLSQERAEASSEALEKERKERGEDRERSETEISALKSENSMLLKDLDRKELALQLKDDKVVAHKERIESLEQTLKEEQDKHLEQLREKQDNIVDLEIQIQQMEMRRRSSAAFFSRDHEDGGNGGVGFGPTDRLKDPSSTGEDSQKEDGDADFDESPDTPPGTPPPISAGGLLPPEDPTQDQIMRDWENDRKVRAFVSTEFDLDRLRDFIEKLPHDAKEGSSRILLDAVAPEGDQQIAESQILIKSASKDTQQELKDFLIPLLKAHKSMRVTYATRQRKTLVTDVRITLEPRASSVTGPLGPDEKRFGKDHAFYGPSADDVSKLVLHAPRTITTEKKSNYVSKPVVEQLPAATPSASSSTTESEQGESPKQQPAGEPEAGGAANGDAGAPTENGAAVANRRWRGMSVPSARLIGTMVAGAKQRVAAKFTNAKYAHEGTSCQFCKISPIIGARYSCGTCVGFDLCENCYQLGGHGLENSDEMFFRVQELVLARCARLVSEVDLLELLRFEICRSNLRKFNFCLNWLADIISGKTSRDLQARALEIPSIRRDVRKRFVPLLMMVCSDRDDIEVKTEWELESDNAAEVRSVVRGSLSEGDGKFLETLRIWVADQYRTTSPFIERNLLKYREGGMALEEEDEDENGEGSDEFDEHGERRLQKKTSSGGDGDAHDQASSSSKPPLPKKKSSKNLDNEDEERSATSKQGFLERNKISSQEF
ncbi:Kinesin heavy chain [Globisporangium polare]